MRNKFYYSFCVAVLIMTAGPAFAQDPSQPALTREEMIALDPQLEGVEVIMALPYLQGYVKAPEKTNVITYNRSQAYPGYNLYASGHTGAAYLTDMKGNVRHQWVYPIEKVWPGRAEEGVTPFFENVHLLPNGDLLAIFHYGGVIKLDKDSNLLWSFPVRCHHALSVDEQGNIYTLTEERVKLKEDVYMLDNAILILSPDGRPLQKLSFLKMMHESQNPAVDIFLRNVLGIAFSGGEDVYHSNTLKVLDGGLSSTSPIIFKKGNLLVCMLTISTIAIVDPQLQDFVWLTGPGLWLAGQHDPSLLKNGNMITFDNHYKGSKDASRIIEFDPLTRDVIWEYTADGFYSDTHGSVERLPNGNTLVISTNKGRVFELTPDKKIVWEFLNPHKTGEDNDLIAAVFALYRIDPKYVSSWLK